MGEGAEGRGLGMGMGRWTGQVRALQKALGEVVIEDNVEWWHSVYSFCVPATHLPS